MTISIEAKASTELNAATRPAAAARDCDSFGVATRDASAPFGVRGDAVMITVGAFLAAEEGVGGVAFGSLCLKGMFLGVFGEVRDKE